MVHKKGPGRPRKPQSDRDADRLAFVDAAVALLREGGVAALNARAVSERMGGAVGALYGTFGSLEALRLEANAVTMKALRAALEDALVSCATVSPGERLQSLAEAYLAFAARNHNAWAALFERRRADVPAAMAADTAALFILLEGILRDADVPRDIDVPLLAKALWSSVHGMVYLADAGGLGPVGPGDVPPMISTLIRAAVGEAPRTRAAQPNG